MFWCDLSLFLCLPPSPLLSCSLTNFHISRVYFHFNQLTHLCRWFTVRCICPSILSHEEIKNLPWHLWDRLGWQPRVWGFPSSPSNNSSLIFNSPKLETIQMSINTRVSNRLWYIVSKLSIIATNSGNKWVSPVMLLADCLVQGLPRRLDKSKAQLLTGFANTIAE